ncbi:MAG: hypothetical protein OXC82_14665, partial [Rhodobacteraceae bacterium]|nr:hypothetical protein [Paracoccaceae bacterium]
RQLTGRPADCGVHTSLLRPGHMVFVNRSGYLSGFSMKSFLIATSEYKSCQPDWQEKSYHLGLVWREPH